MFPPNLIHPPLRPVWADARKAAETTAGTLKETAKFAEMRKKMKGDLGPDLEAWPKFYPDYAKLKSGKEKIEETMKKYTEAIKASGLNDKVKKPMLDALVKVKADLEKRLEAAHKLIESDMKLALKASLRTQIRPITVFDQDVAHDVQAKAGSANETLKLNSMHLVVKLTDENILKHVPNDVDDGALAVKIRTAADFAGVTQQLANLLVKVSKDVHSEKDLPEAKQKLKEGLDKIVEQALDRAAAPILELAKVKVEHRNYQITAAVTLVATGAGIVASTAALLSAPFTNVAGAVVGFYGLTQGCISFGIQIGKLAADAEGVAAKISRNLKAIHDQYQNRGATAVGAAEVATTLANALAPAPVLSSITTVKGDCDLLGDKIKGLTVSTHEAASDLGKLLTAQEKVQTELTSFEKISKGKLTPQEAQNFQKLMKAIEASAGPVDTCIKKVEDLNTRVVKMTASHKTLKGKVDALASGKPNWAQVGELVVNVAVATAFLVGGNVNTPNAYQGLDALDKAGTWVGNIASIGQTAYSTAMALKDQIEKAK